MILSLLSRQKVTVICIPIDRYSISIRVVMPQLGAALNHDLLAVHVECSLLLAHFTYPL